MTRFFHLCIFAALVCYAQGQSIVEKNVTDAKGQKQGYWEKTYPNGQLWYQGNFKDDRPVGEFRRYNEDGSLKTIQDYRTDGKSCYTRLYYQNGELAAEGLYQNNKKDSVWKYFSFYDKTLSLTETYSGGERNGPTIKYYPSGQPAEKVLWIAGKREGEWVQFFETGSPKLKANYTGDKLNGQFVFYFPNGRVEITGMYSNNLQEGVWQYFTLEGILHMTLEYRAGKALDTEKLDAQQREYFEMIEENIGKIREPDEDSLMPGRGN